MQIFYLSNNPIKRTNDNKNMPKTLTGTKSEKLNKLKKKIQLIKKL